MRNVSVIGTMNQYGWRIVGMDVIYWHERNELLGLGIGGPNRSPLSAKRPFGDSTGRTRRRCHDVVANQIAADPRLATTPAGGSVCSAGAADADWAGCTTVPRGRRNPKKKSGLAAAGRRGTQRSTSNILRPIRHTQRFAPDQYETFGGPCSRIHSNASSMSAMISGSFVSGASR